MKYFSLTIIGITSIVLVACNQNNTSNKLYVPKEIQWDTLKNGFGENIDLYHKAFEVLYISNDTIYKINMENELVDDSILMISPLSIIEYFKIIDRYQNALIFIRGNKKDTLLLNLYTDSNISEESYLRIKNLIYNRDNVPEELVLPK
ncbi:MAG: hypothetical protein HXL43_09260 [Solobacterium sp.]|nr:hypothetical protein [Solobacterium sp.]